MIANGSMTRWHRTVGNITNTTYVTDQWLKEKKQVKYSRCK